uniref:Putative LOV domain-containing protein n=1 Tax=Phyllanthus sp. BC-2016 TaxID=1799614 RepID=A0A126X418_9ROSI|nr:putative LOV domain-containing protein [Phyllanthus sp. BC-2016]
MDTNPQLGLIQQSFITRYSDCAHEALDQFAESFTITDPCISGQPIVFASKGFLKMSGYSISEVLGRNGRVFQGPKTDRRAIMEIREAVREERGVEISLLNYRKDGTPFWMLFRMCPVFGKDDGRVINFVAVQVPLMKKQRSYCNGVMEMYGSCRKEVCFDSSADFDAVSGLDNHIRELRVDEVCEASDVEKQRAATAINNILSVLTQYSEFSGMLVCAQRCCVLGEGLISSSLNISLGRIKQSFVLVDPYLPDMPIVYASDAFLKLTGYSRNEVLRRNCRFLCGVDTDSSVRNQIEESIKAEQACTVRILNYRKDNSSFWNYFHISPVRNATGKIAYFVEVYIEEGCKSQDRQGMSPEMRQRSVVGAVKVAVRSSSMAASSSKDLR